MLFLVDLRSKYFINVDDIAAHMRITPIELETTVHVMFQLSVGCNFHSARVCVTVCACVRVRANMCVLQLSSKLRWLDGCLDSCWSSRKIAGAEEGCELNEG